MKELGIGVVNTTEGQAYLSVHPLKFDNTSKLNYVLNNGEKVKVFDDDLEMFYKVESFDKEKSGYILKNLVSLNSDHNIKELGIGEVVDIDYESFYLYPCIPLEYNPSQHRLTDKVTKGEEVNVFDVGLTMYYKVESLDGERKGYIFKNVIKFKSQIDSVVYYLCDGNVEGCTKESCFKNGGEYRHTRDIKHARNFAEYPHKIDGKNAYFERFNCSTKFNPDPEEFKIYQVIVRKIPFEKSVNFPVFAKFCEGKWIYYDPLSYNCDNSLTNMGYEVIKWKLVNNDF